jgi:hypothetical protein
MRQAMTSAKPICAEGYAVTPDDLRESCRNISQRGRGRLVDPLDFAELHVTRECARMLGLG